jgi:hypothetical protein
LKLDELMPIHFATYLICFLLRELEPYNDHTKLKFAKKTKADERFLKIKLRSVVLIQGWPTQIGLWAALGKKSKKYQLFDESNGKSLTFDPRLCRRKFFLGRGLATPDLNTQL